jgi:ornithine cyclodeaminase/alanine dehydrogenase-like protein (mu-crystallin family)
MLLLSEDDVRQVLTMDLALEAVEAGFRSMALDEAVNIPRARAQTDHAMLHGMLAASKTLGYLGYKAYVTTRKGSHFHVGLFDGKSGELLSLMRGDYLGQMRTGAASGLATGVMARADAQTVGVFGSGKQARTQLLAVSKARPLSKVTVYSPSEEHRRRFAEEMSRQIGVSVEPVAHPQMAATNQDIVITATTSREPVLHGDWLTLGTHLNVIGSNFLGKTEIDVATIRRSAVVVVDNKDQARLEAGDFARAIEDGLLRWSDVAELPHVLIGRRPGREHPEEITLFKSVGIALEDVAMAGRVYEKAKAAGLGREIGW